MKNLALLAGCALLCCTGALAQPSIGKSQIVNSASGVLPGLPNYGIAQGSIFILLGTGLGPSTLAQVTAYPVPTQVGGTSVTVTVSGTPVKCLMVYSSATQIAAILPSATPAGTGTVTVTYNGQTSAGAPITVVPSAFGMYTLDQAGDGPAVITTTGFQAITLTQTAKPGDSLILWGTGLGPYTGDETNPPTETPLPVSVSLYVGNQQATIAYAGRSSSPGLDQINFTVPAGLSGCYVPVVVVVNGVVSNFGSTSISPTGSVCSDPIGLTSTAINEVLSNGNLRVGFIELQRVAFNASVPILGTLNIKEDSGAAYFYNFNDRALITSRGLSEISSFSSCTVLICTGTTCIPDNSALTVPRLAAGPNITIKGPNGTAVLPQSSNTGEYHGPLGPSGLTGSSYLSAGSYTASNGPGGADVGAFTANLTIGTPLTWTNQSSYGSSVIRANGLTINWSGGSAGDYVAIFGSSTSVDNSVTSTFVCTEKNNVGTFTVPAYVLSALPVSGTLTQSGVTIPGGFLLLGEYPLSNTFTAPGLDLGYFTETVVNGINTSYK